MGHATDHRMGPITLFDKSFLQSLSLDESVWFDHFFFPNICPLFYIETLADLTKIGRTPERASEDEVAIIAAKTPDLSGGPCIHHQTLCLARVDGTSRSHGRSRRRCFTVAMVGFDAANCRPR